MSERLRGPRKSPEIRRRELADYLVNTSKPISEDGLIRATVSLTDANEATGNHCGSTNRDRNWPRERILQECSSIDGLEVLKTPGMVFKLTDTLENQTLVASIDADKLPDSIINTVNEIAETLDSGQLMALASYIVQNVANKSE